MTQEMEWRPVPAAGLDIALTDRAESAVFERFFAGYDRAFVLPNEKEDEAGFAACLALNHSETGARLRRAHGAFAEICLIARDSASGAFVGGANFIALKARGEAGPIVTANLNYIYVDAAMRGQGCFGRLVAATRTAIGWSLDAAGEGAGADPLIFIEQNDPLRMPAEDYARDTAFTGLDQLDRMRIWARQGARVVDHPYVQPPLGPDAEPDDNLIYGALSDAADLAACTLRDHLAAFFAISVLKGAPLADVPVAAAQIAALDEACARDERIVLLDPTRFLAAVPSRADAEAMFRPWPESTRAAIREIGAIS